MNEFYQSRIGTALQMSYLLLVVFLILSVAPAVFAQPEEPEELPPCEQRISRLDTPPVDERHFCLENVSRSLPPYGGEMWFTALVTTPNGTLYTVRPHTGELFALTDSTNTGSLPHDLTLIAAGMTLPNALAYHEGILYIAGGAHLYHIQLDRWQGGQPEILVDDLPSGAGFWTGGLAVGEDERIYVGIGANCDYCIPDDDRGMILSFDLNGGDRKIVARGLRHPAGLTWYDGALWVTDTARDGLTRGRYDELNRLEIGEDVPHFGWPYCIGVDNTPDWPDATFDCTQATAPVMTFPTHSTPLALAVYSSETLPELTGSLLIVQSGSSVTSIPDGYNLIALPISATDEFGEAQIVLPYGGDLLPGQNARLRNRQLQLAGKGFWPHHLYGLAVSPKGWIYLSVGGGRIYALRPG